MKSIRVSHLLRSFAAMLAVLLVLQGFLMFKQGQTLRSDLLYNAEVLIPSIQNLHDAKLHVVQVQQWLTDISATRGLNGLNDGFDEAAVSAEQFRETINSLIGLHPEHETKYRALLALFEPYYAEGQKMATGYVEGGPEVGNSLMAAFDAKAASINDNFDQLFNDLKDSIDDELHHELADIDTNNRLIFIFSTCFTILLILLLIVGQTRIVAPAKYLAAELQAIANGDFSRSINRANDDEFGEIADATARIVTQLGESLRAITSAGMQVSAYAHALTYVTNDLKVLSEEQSEGTVVVVNSIDELTELGQTVAAETLHASDVSSEVKIQAQKGDQLLESSLLSSQQLAEGMNSAKSTVNELAESSNKINEVMSVIQGIAEQTNLLALNAAIEAARAGEQGRGFAVVADEVRTLASRTQDSASQIEGMINTLQSKAHETVALITKTQEQAAENAEAGEKASEALRVIFSSINELDKMNQNIKSASESQSSRYEEVVTVIAKSKEISERFALNSKQSDRFSQSLSEQAQAFSDLATKLSVY